MTENPASAISSSAVCQGICFSSSGNQTPHWSGHTPMVSLLYRASGLVALAAADSGMGRPLVGRWGEVAGYCRGLVVECVVGDRRLVEAQLATVVRAEREAAGLVER